MSTHPSRLPEELYHRHSEQAAQLQLTPEQLIERLIARDVADVAPVGLSVDESEIPVPPAGADEALAAERRLTTLFADVVIADLDQVLADPMIALANADVGPAAEWSTIR